MAIKVDCPYEGYEGCYIEFRDSGYTFGDRRGIIESDSDVKTLNLIHGFIESWNLKDVGGQAVKFDPEGGIDLYNNFDDSVIIPWIIAAWFEAKSKRAIIPKVS